MRCPSCNHDNRADRRFCTECGATLSMACPSCGAPAESGEKFCGGCGTSLVAAPTSSTTPPRQPATVTAAPAELGERRQLTILFSDLVGSTELSTQLDPEEWRDRVAQYHRVTVETVEKFGG